MATQNKEQREELSQDQKLVSCIFPWSHTEKNCHKINAFLLSKKKMELEAEKNFYFSLTKLISEGQPNYVHAIKEDD